MFLKALLHDRYCHSRYIGYFEHAITVFYKHELKSLAELFGSLGNLLPHNLNLQQEYIALTDLLRLETLNLPPPLVEEYFDQFSTPFRLAHSVALSSSVILLLHGLGYTLPTGYESVAGNVQFQQAGNTLNVSTQATHSIANYQTFNINQGETVNFNLSSAQSVILNRVTGSASPSEILGSMNSNGQVFITNPSGIIFGASAQVNVGALHATTLGISDQDFLNSKYTFTQGTNPSASVINQGAIQTQPGGYVVLSGGHIENAGNIYAPQGQINLAVGSQITMTVDDNIAVNVTVDQSLKRAVQGIQDAVTNTGTLNAPGGIIQAQANLEASVYNSIVNNQGLVEAQGFENVNGKIVFSGNSGSNALVNNAGTIDVSGTIGSANGGSVSMNGDYVAQEGKVLADALENGTAGHIEVTSFKGSLLATGSLTSAKGNADDSTGGSIRIWSNNNTFFDTGAVVDVSGGSVSGNAGYLELSGKNYLSLNGTLLGYANNGIGGKLLIDPANIVIQNGGGSSLDNLTSPQELFGNSPGSTMTFDPTGAGQFFGHGFTDITLQATGNITVNSAFDTSTASYNDTAHAVSLSLIANNNITISAPVTTHGANITLTADNGGSNTGILTITGTGSVTSNNANVTLSGSEFVLSSGGSINAGTGTVSILPTTNKNINVGGSTDNNDSAALLDISAPELARITAGTLAIGDITKTGNITIAGNIDVSGLSSTAGVYDLTFNTGGNFNQNGNTIQLGKDALYFNGTNQYVMLPSGDTSGLTAFTISFWVKTTDNGSSGTYWQEPALIGVATNGVGSNDFGITTNSGKLAMWSGLHSGIDNNVITGKTINDNTWHQVVAVNDGTNINLYVDGNSTSVGNISSGLALSATQFYMGAQNNQASSPAGAYYYHQGQISDFRVYNTAFSTNQISTLYNGGAGEKVTVPQATMVAGYNFSQGSGTSLTDYSGNNYTGSLQSSPTWQKSHNLTINAGGTVTTSNIFGDNNNVSITSSQAIISSGSQIYTGPSGNITIKPSNNTNITIGGSTDNYDATAGTLDISAPELGRLTAGTITIGDITKTGNIITEGNIDVSGVTGTAGVYNLAFNTGGNFINTGNTINMGRDALYFNGVNQYATINNPISGDWTISFWMKASSTGNNGGSNWYNGSGLVDGDVAGVANDFGVSWLGQKIAFGVGNPDTTLSSPSNLSLNSWHYVTLTRVSSSGLMTMYVDGTSVGSLTGPTGTKNANTTLELAKISQNQYYYNGYLDDVRLYNTALTSGQITTLYNTGIGNTVTGPLSNLQAGYNFNAGSGTTTADVSGNSNTASLINNPTWITSKNITINASGTVNTGTIYEEGSPIQITSSGNLTVDGGIKAIGNGTIQLTASGASNLYQSSALTAEANNITLSSGTGNIGTNANNILTYAYNTLTANTSGSGNVYISDDKAAYTTSFVLGASSAGGLFSLAHAGSDIKVNGALTAGNITFNTNWGISLGAAVTANTGDITLIADGDGNAIDHVTIAAALTDTVGNITIQSPYFHLLSSGTINNGGHVLEIKPSTSNRNITIGGTTDDYDATSNTLDISSPELSRITTGRLVVGQWGGYNITTTGNINLNASGAGAYELDLQSGAITAINNAINANNHNIVLYGTEIQVAQSMNAGTGYVGLYANAAEAINVGGTTDSNDSPTLLDISMPELNRITANSVTVGGTWVSGGITVVGNISLAASGAGAYNFNLGNAGTITDNFAINTNNHTLGMATGSNGNIVLNANTNSGNTSTTINANGSGTITQTSGTVTANSVTLTSGTGNIGTSGAKIFTAASTLTANTGGTGNVYVSNTGVLSLLGSSAGNTFSLFNGGGNLTVNGAVSAPIISITTPWFISVLGNITSSNGTITILADSDFNGGDLTIGANISAGTGTVTLQSGASNIIENAGTVTGGNITLTAGSGYIGTSGSYIQTAPGTLTVNAGGNAYVNDSGTASLAASSVGNSATMIINAAGAGALSVIGNVSAGTNSAITLTGGSNLSIGANISSSGGNINLNAHGSGATGILTLASGDNITSTGSGIITLEAAQAIINSGSSINAGGANSQVVIYPYQNQTMTIGGVTDNNDSNNNLDISMPEMNRITAGTLYLGANWFPLAGLSTTGNINLNSAGASTAPGAYQLILRNSSPININNDINTGNHPLTLSTHNSNADVSIGANLTSGTNTILISAGGTGNIVQTTGLISGANITLTSGSGNIGTSGTPIQTGPTTLTVTTTGNAWVNDSGNTTLAASSVGNNDTLQVNANGNLTTSGVITAGGNGIISLTTGSNGNIVLGSTIGTNTDTTLIDANGSGTITQTSGTVLGSNITLTSGSGDIGTSGTNIQTGPGTLTVNTAGNAWLNDSGDTTLAASSAGNNATFMVNTTGNLTTSGAVAGGTNTLVDLLASGNLSVGSTLTTTNGPITLNADSGNANNGNLTINGNLNSNNGNITLIGAEAILSQNINTGTGAVLLKPTTSKAINVGGSTDNNDSNVLFDISAPELARITAGNLTIGATALTGGLNVIGNLNVSGAGPAGAYNLAFDNGGNYVATGKTMTLGSKSLTVNALGTVNTGSITGASGTASLTSGGLLTADGSISLGGNLTLQSTGDSVNLDSAGAANSITASNITWASSLVAGKGVNIQNAGTLVEAQGAGGSNLTYSDTGTPVTTGMTINAGAGSAGSISVNGDFASLGTLKALGNGGNVTINYNNTDLDLTNVTIQTNGSSNGTITLTNDTSGAGNNGTLIAQTGAQSGTVTINTFSNHSITGTGTSITTGNLIFDVANAVNLNGNFNSSPITGTTSNGAFNLTDTTSNLVLSSLTSASTVSLTSKGDISVNGNVTSNGAMTLTADSGDANSGNLVINGNLNSTNGNMTLIGAEAILNQSINAGSGNLILQPTTGKAINVGGTTDNNDSNVLFDVSAPELSRITANTLTVGTTGLTGGLNVIGNLDVSGAGPAGAYNLVFDNGGNYTASGETILLGSKALTVNALGTATLDTVTGTGGANSITAQSGGNLSVIGTLTTSNGPINLTANGAGTLDLSNASAYLKSNNGAITLQGNDVLLPGTFQGVLAGTGNVTVTATNTINDSSAGTAVLYTNGNLFMQTTSGGIGTTHVLHVAVGGTTTVNGTGGHDINLIYNSVGTIEDIHTGGAGNISLTAWALVDNASVTSPKISTTGNLTLSANSGDISLQKLNIGGTVTAANSFGNIILNGLSSTLNLGNISATRGVDITSGTLTQASGTSISEGATYTGTLSSTSGDIGTATNNMQLGSGTYSILSAGKAYINDTGDMTLATSSAGNNATFMVNATGNLTTSGAVTGGANTLVDLLASGNLSVGNTITTTNGPITLNADSGNANNGNLTVNGNLTSNNGNITLIGAEAILFQNINAGTGTVLLKPTTNKAINVGGTTDNNDSNVLFDISAPELGRIAAGTLTIGDVTKSGGLNVIGNIDVSGAGPSEAYNLVFDNGGNYVATGETITLGSKSLTVNATGTINTGTLNATSGNITMASGGNLTEDGAIASNNTISLGTTANGNITLQANVSNASSIDLNANGSGIISQTGGLVSGTSGQFNSGSGDITLHTNLSSIGASITGNIQITNDTGYTVVAGGISGSTVNLTNSAGDLTFNGGVSGSNVTLTSASNILNTGAGTDLTATAGASMRSGGYIGTVVKPVTVNVSGGNLGIQAPGMLAGVSGDINGTVLPSNTLSFVATPPGYFYFNGINLFPPPAPPPSPPPAPPPAPAANTNNNGVAETIFKTTVPGIPVLTTQDKINPIYIENRQDVNYTILPFSPVIFTPPFTLRTEATTTSDGFRLIMEYDIPDLLKQYKQALNTQSHLININNPSPQINAH